ncbi:MAG: UDP-N-acetylmuramoyl-L-alanyl-D-glutamate--2,6-diaminopimelate ligase [Ruminococcaceae bacterium]|nr:UDP-N-acetylmuramoyl-L-alanyl-D-glutamate--2,6-diaminopimelate ligase [Oscillospiraceae bacterium]
MTFSQLSAPFSPRLFGKDPHILGITPDPARCRDGFLYVCISGFKRDGHDAVEDALRAGAVACVAAEARPAVIDLLTRRQIPHLVLPDTRKGEAILTSRLYHDPWKALKITAVTGTNGKTTVVSMLHAIYAMAGYKTAVIGTLTGKLTTPDPAELYPKLAELREEGVTHVFMEASSHALSLGKLAPIVFDAAVFTNLTPEHLDFHSTMEEYAAAKATLFRQARRTILNADDPHASYMAAHATGRIYTCSAREKPTDFTATHIVPKGCYGSSYDLVTTDRLFRITTPIPGEFTVMNTMEAAVAALTDGIPKDIIRGAIGGFQGVKGRLERIPLPTSDYAVYIDFAHTPDALKNILLTVRGFMSDKQRLVLLFGCGGDRDRSKRPVMGSIASHLADFVIVTADNSRSERTADIMNAILSGFDGNASHTAIESRREAIEYAVTAALPGDVILLCGKGHEEYEILGGDTRPFSEREIVLAAAARRLREKGVY